MKKPKLIRVADMKNSATFYEELLMMRVQQEIESLMKAAGVSQGKLGKKLKVGKAAVSRMLDSDRNLTLRSFAKISFVLGSEVMPVTRPIEGRETVPAPKNWVILDSYRYKTIVKDPPCVEVELEERLA